MKSGPANQSANQALAPSAAGRSGLQTIEIRVAASRALEDARERDDVSSDVERPSLSWVQRDVADARYSHAMRASNKANAIGAVLVHVLTLLSVVRHPSKVMWVVGSFALLTPLNIWISISLIPKRGPFYAEIVRTGVNVGLALWLNHVIGWTLPVWLWLPYHAIAHERFHPRLHFATLTATAAANTAVALYDGVPWIYPLSFTALAYLCRALTDQRLAIIRDMFRRSEEQRRALDDAQASLSAVEARERAQAERRQAHKLEAIGRLAAGIAHEIHTPLQYAMNSVEILQGSAGDLADVIDRFRDVVSEAKTNMAPEVREQLEQYARDRNVDATRQEMTEAATMAVDGLARVSAIVQAMNEWAHPERGQKTRVDLNRAVETTLLMAKHQYRYVAEIETDFETLPPVECHPGEINQALLNLIVNAAHAVGQAIEGTDRKGRITVRTRATDDAVVVSISDTGTGIPPSIHEKIFEPFFTTKPVGAGTGQGLAFVHSIVVDKHGGTLTFETATGVGTTFHLRLPVSAQSSGSKVAA